MTNSRYYIFDIDGTLTKYNPSVRPENFLHHNFLFPTLRDLMIELGMTKPDAENGILRVITEIPFWDYTDVISEFNLPAKEAWKRMWEWHIRNMEIYDDTVQMAKTLFQEGKTLFVVSNNPYSGCCMKLKLCGLGDEFGSTVFRRIFSTDKLRGCKCDPLVWKRAINQIPDDPAKICTVGDNPVEDGEIPRSLGVGRAIILSRAGISRGIE